MLPSAVVLLGGIAIEAAAMLAWLGRMFDGTDPSGAEIPA
jgi:hypothetical protein